MAGNHDRSSIGGRIRRYAQVTGTMSGLAARLAGERYLGFEIDRSKHANQLREALGSLKGPLMKVAQILSTIPDALPKEYAEELAALQADAPSMGWLFVKRRMRSELGDAWESKFDSFDKKACSAASLGQVHQAIYQNNKVAVKLQYPDMDSAINADLNQLKLVFSLYERIDSAISTKDIHQELSDRLREELDYQREALNMQLYRLMLAQESEVVLPEPIAQLSSDRVLTMSWVEGQKLTKYLEAEPSQEERNKVAINMFRTWYVPFYYYGVIHGDPHLGNYSIGEDLKINLMDFGSIRIFRPAFVGGVIDLYKALRDGDNELAVHAYSQWGFSGLDKEAIDILNIWAGFIYGPLLEDRVRPIQELRGGNYGRELAGKVHEELKRIGGIRPPREFVLMDRAAVGLGSVFMHLNAQVNWHQLFHGLIEDFTLEQLTHRQRQAIRKVGLPETLLEE
ncbi:AarF/UbiB family protein [Alphaproteobacteria bacterium]|jgi:predicted unusual protein kinase regulating ubiquinone biosynthesis (AarF/ABC1/UbiB family)|nr:AarF/ABC1/UbiB kinase family protein [Alphaproteobacteria bacterium]MBT5799420.1 AarF/ABC1/UbiB kinase family protein [Alphaproteobacteria bacterium]MDA9190011.1 AarF/UbiB family protein [Alphaproteobacteria bacterium]MDA9815737.1 AarF/UbiB family protein [Alphaproteobacteria bacterium]